MTVSFRRVTEVAPVGEGEFEADIPDKWQQGRGAFGGIVFGVMLRAARAHEADPARTVRSFACDVAGPVLPGKATVRVRALRRGRNQSNLQLDLVQEGAVQASALCTVSSARKAKGLPVTPALPAEATRDWQSVPVVPRLPGEPTFVQHFEFRNLGPVPFCAGSEATTMGFVRLREPDGVLDVPALSALLDSYWPTLFSIARTPFPITTVSYNAQFMPGSELSCAEPLLFRGRALTQTEGYVVEFRELWSRDRLVALNQQTLAVLG